MLKRTLMFGMACTAMLATARQDTMQMPKAPKEMEACKDMVGTWSGEMTMFMGPESMKSKDTMVCAMVMGGRYMEAKHTIEMPGMGTMEGRQLMTYSEKEKMYVSWWFDSMESDAMVQKGKMEGKKLVLVSEPIEMAGMPGKSVFRSTYWGEGSKGNFLMESKGEDGKWNKMIEAVYTKK